MNRQTTTLCACGIVFFVISAIAYVITMGVGWALSRSVYPSPLFGAGAIIATIPILAVGGAILTSCYCGSDSKFTDAAFYFAIFIVCIAGLFEVIGAVLFIIGGAQLKDENSQALGHGIAAGVFGLIAGISCCFSTIACCGGLKDDEPKNTTEP